MAKPKDLPDDVKTRIVIENACFQTPSRVAALVREEFDVEITRQTIEAYDPKKVAGKALSKKWRDLFDEARELYLKDTASIGIASRVFRLRKLQELYDRFTDKNPVLAINLLREAREEDGGGRKLQLEHSLSNPLMELAKQVMGTAFRPVNDADK